MSAVTLSFPDEKGRHPKGKPIRVAFTRDRLIFKAKAPLSPEALREIAAMAPKPADIEIDRPAGSGGFMFQGRDDFMRTLEHNVTRRVQEAIRCPIHSEDCT